MFDVIIAAIVGIFVGGVVNALADELPYRTFFRKTLTPPQDATDEEIQEYAEFNALLVQRNQRGYLPVYPDGTPRPISAWLGLTAFALGQREPAQPQPDEARDRPHRESKKLSWRHPFTEIMTAVFFALAAYAAPDIEFMTLYSPQYWLNFIYMAIFSLIIVIDMEHKLILFVVMIPATILALLDAYFIPKPYPGFIDALIGAGAGFGAFFTLYLLGFVFRWFMNNFRGHNITTVAFGYGDVMMLTLTGALVGTVDTLIAVFITTFLGAIGAFLYLIARKIVGERDVMMTAIPYGPYIVIATLIMLLWGDYVWAYFAR